MELKFTKMHGLGNDFMVIDAVRQKVFLNPELIKRLGDRHFGVGFDQLLLVEPPYKPQDDFHYRIFNQDGSEVQMCGNGARCFARFVIEQGLTNKRELHVSTMAGELVLNVTNDDEVVVNMGAPILTPSKIPFAFDEAKEYSVDLGELGVVKFGAVSMGNPHMTTIVDDIETCAIATQGPVLECHPMFPEKVNVGFMQIIDRTNVKLRVYERGCGETMACGTGACAAAVVGMVQGHLDSKVKVTLPGGTLTISWAGGHEPVMMKGSATTVYQGVINI